MSYRGIKIFFVQDLIPELQTQYFIQRDYWMTKKIRLENYSARKDDFDSISFLVAAVKENKDIVGGLRLTLGNTKKTKSLPSEFSPNPNDPPFLFKDYFPEHYQSTNTIGEISKLFINNKDLKNYSTSEISKNMVSFLFSQQDLVHEGQTKKARYIYCRTSKVHLLLYIRLMKRLRIPYIYKKLSDEVIPQRMEKWIKSYGGVYVVSCDISNNLVNDNRDDKAINLSRDRRNKIIFQNIECLPFTS